MFRRPAEREGAPRLDLRARRSSAPSGRIDASIHAGEIVGLVGLRGAGQETVGRALFGVEPVTGGRFASTARGRHRARRARAMALGVNLVCADRVGESILPGLSVRENFFLNPLAAGPGADGRGSRPRARMRGARAARRDRRPAAQRSHRSRSNCCRAAISRRSWSAAGST